MNKSLLSNKGASKKEKAPKTTNSESFFKERLMAALLIGSILIILSLSIILLAQSCFKIASTSPSPSVANKPETAGVPLASGDYEKRMIDLKTSKLNPDQLKGLIGMHFVENDEEIKAMSLDTAKVIKHNHGGQDLTCAI